jgi:phospholipid/cholesterol/gamma-HCH transport system ATP-binding protein
MSTPVIEVRDIVTRFGTTTVHDGVSFSIAPGQIVAIIGGSGCGKSVLLKEAIGLLKPTSGSISICGQDVWSASELQLEELRKRYGVLFQNGALFSALTVGENVAVPLKEDTRLPNDVINDIVELRLGLSGLPPSVSAKMPAELSGGMRKRAALARALALEPELLFLDEPTSGLDPINARAFDRLIRTLCDGIGLTVVMVTHDLDTLESIVDTVIALADGKVLAQGSVAAVSHVDHPWIKSYFSARVSKS